MIDRLPRWVWIGAWLLAVIAGMVNVVGLLGFEHQAITHLTGTTTMLGATLARADGVGFRHFALLILSFVAGAMISGFVVRDSTLRLGRRYGAALALESVLLASAAVLLSGERELGHYLASCACGLQNAMVSTYSGATIRTTHVSGMFTDLGIYVGHAVRGMRIDMRRLRLSVTVISGYLIGATAGALLFDVFHYATLYAPAALTGGVGLSYGLYSYYARRRGP